MKQLWRLASFLAPKLILTRGAKGGDAVYLSFDDGPDARQTERLLTLLAQHQAKAIFFLIGERAQEQVELVARMLADGHVIGNHSMSHPRMRRLGMRAQWQQIDRADVALSRIDGRRWHGFRPPHGQVTWAMLLVSLWRRRPLVLWSLDSWDYKLDPEAVVNRLRANPPKRGDIVLFHDDAECALLALEVLLPEWTSAGLCFAALECDT